MTIWLNRTGELYGSEMLMHLRAQLQGAGV